MASYQQGRSLFHGLLNANAVTRPPFQFWWAGSIYAKLKVWPGHGQEIERDEIDKGWAESGTVVYMDCWASKSLPTPSCTSRPSKSHSKTDILSDHGWLPHNTCTPTSLPPSFYMPSPSDFRHWSCCPAVVSLVWPVIHSWMGYRNEVWQSLRGKHLARANAL